MKMINFFAMRFAETFDLWRNRPVTAIYALIGIAILQLTAWGLFNLLGFSYGFYQALMGAAFGLLIVIPICLLSGWWCKRQRLEPQVKCPACRGTGKEVSFHNTGTDSSEHYSSLDTCTVCHGSGKASAAEAAKIEKRHQFWNGILKN